MYILITIICSRPNFSPSIPPEAVLKEIDGEFLIKKASIKVYIRSAEIRSILSESIFATYQ